MTLNFYKQSQLHILSWLTEESRMVWDDVDRAPPQRWPVCPYYRQRSTVATCHIEPASGPLAAVAVHHPIPHTCASLLIVCRIRRGCSCIGSCSSSCSCSGGRWFRCSCS